MTRFFKRCDAWMMLHFFHPVAWYVDARWHKNQFVLASGCVVLAMFVLAVQMAFDLMGTGWMRLLCVVSVAINLWLYQDWLRRFRAAAKWQDDNPGKLCFPHHSYIFFPGELRFSWLLFSLFMFTTLFALLPTLKSALPGLWMMLICCSMCFAGVYPPPPGARREKKEKALTWFAPAPSMVP